MGPEFITRSLKTCAVVLLIFIPFGIYYMTFYQTLAVVSGAVWSILNLVFLTRLIRVTLRPDGMKALPAIGMAIFKFPLLYIAGYFLLTVEQFDPMYLVIGFTAVMGVLLLRLLGRSFVESGPKADNVDNLQKVL